MVSQLIDKMLKGDRRALAQLCTLMERDAEELPVIMRAIYPHAGAAYCIGVTGPPGAGKSTVVDGLVQILRSQESSVGVLAVDPTSPFTGGAVLGDRIRMQRHYLDDGVFIRSLATRGVHGGLSRVARASVVLLDAFGKDVIIVETVGVGQTESDIMGVADTVVVVLAPEAGDAVQVMKAGLMEIADVFVVNKADRPGAKRLAAAIKATLRLDSSKTWWRPPVLSAKAHKGEGIQDLHDTIAEHRRAMEEGSHLEQRRRRRQRQEFAQSLTEALDANITRLIAQDGTLSELAERVEKGELDPYSAAAQALDDGRLFSHLARAASQGRPPTQPKASRQSRGYRSKR